MSGQSAPTKQSAPCTGTSSPTTPRTTSTCSRTTSTTWVQLRRPTSNFSARGRRKPPSTFSVGRPPVALGVDDPDTGVAHDQVVDVGAGPGDPPVVQDALPCRRELVQPSAERLFTDGAGVPGAGALRVVGDGEDELAEARVRGADALLPLGLATFVLPARRRTRHAGVEFLGDDRGRGGTLEATDGLRRALVDRRLARRQVGGTESAGAGVPQPHALVVGSRGRRHSGTVGLDPIPAGDFRTSGRSKTSAAAPTGQTTAPGALVPASVLSWSSASQTACSTAPECCGCHGGPDRPRDPLRPARPRRRLSGRRSCPRRRGRTRTS